MPQYTWVRDLGNGTCTHIECDGPASARAIHDRLVANGVSCHVHATTVMVDKPTPFIEVIRISEPFVGARLMS